MATERSKQPVAGPRTVTTRYFKGEPKEALLFQRELLNFEIAQAIYDTRMLKGLTQSELAKKVGTSASVISRVEDSDYTGRSLNLLLRIAVALDLWLSLKLTPNEPRPKARRIKPRRPAA